jgi:hypothetical protein
MKLTTALSAAAFVLAPGAGFAMEPLAATNHYPYPDWPAVAKTAPVPQKAAEEERAPGSKGEHGLLEKAGQAVVSITGQSAGAPEGTAQQNKDEPGFLEKAKQAVESVPAAASALKRKPRRRLRA